MLETLAKGFRAARQRLTGVAELDDNVIEDALRDVRLSLLEGDVEFRVVKRFLERVREAAHGKQVELRAKSKDYGTRLANYFISNSDELGVLYVIWFRIKSPQPDSIKRIDLPQTAIAQPLT